MKACLFALDIGGTFLKACLCGLDADPIPGSFDREPVDSDGEIEKVRRAYQALIRRMKEKADSLGFALAAVAADIPGPFDFKAGVSRMEHKYTALYGVPLRPWFEEILGDVPVYFMHDSSAFLAGASLSHPEIKNAAGAMIGTGLGFALMQNGVILQNDTGGPAVSIYRRPFRGATAEDFVSGRAVVRRYNEISPTPTNSGKTVGDRAEAGEKDAVTAYESLGEDLAAIVAPILKEYGVEAFYLGGQISKSFSVFEKKLREGLKDVPTLRVVEAAKDLDLAHLRGVSRRVLSEHPELFRREALKLEAVCKEIVWGGTRLCRDFHKPEGKTAEAWELAVHPEGICRIENGAYAGKTLADYLGTDRDFPIMIKLIDAADRLSIQVHPAKTEMWVVLDADPGAQLVYGLKEKFDEAAFRKALDEGRAEELLNFVPVRPGDVFFIPQGLVHAIGAGILIAEIQENSNVTYRVYDYGRLQNGKPRELHVDAAMKTIRDFSPGKIESIRYSRGRGEATTLANCSLFRVDRLTVKGRAAIPPHAPFTSVVCIEGEGSLDGEAVRKGDSFFLPAACGEVRAEGEMTLLVTTP